MTKIAVPSVTALVDVELMKDIYRNHTVGKGRVISGYLTAFRLDTFVRFLGRKDRCKASNAYLASRLGIGKTSVYKAERLLSGAGRGRSGSAWESHKFSEVSQIPSKFVAVPEFAIFDLTGEEFAFLVALSALSEGHILSSPERRENDSRGGILPASARVPLGKKDLSAALSGFAGMANYEVVCRKLRSLSDKGYVTCGAGYFKLTPYTVMERAKEVREGLDVYEWLKNKKEKPAEKKKEVQLPTLFDLSTDSVTEKVAYTEEDFNQPVKSLEKMWCEGVSKVTEKEVDGLSSKDKVILYKCTEDYNKEEVVEAMDYLFDSWDSMRGTGKINPKAQVKWFVSALPALISRVRNRKIKA